ncbi:glycosyltransferase [Caulobacter sp. BE254]|uniref:glycosyltransferase n=1 Tax=Caulobacter sp. BE254 TaxID=2817720 RepID=UPI00286185D5|nr:glycosyltransferase [Caulobacter sp. BE254]MDR7116521.1 glycosyltransferase involved in cell wall biosynthesis [Caulobacter sp. BE254]
MTAILHAMLGKGLGGLEQVFLDYQPILEAYAATRGGAATGLVRAGGQVAVQQAGRVPPLATMPAFTDWDPLTLGAARAIVRTTAPDLILSHGQRPARLLARVAPPGALLAVCVHKPAFDVETTRTHFGRTHYVCVGQHLAELAAARGVPAERVHFVPNAVKPPTVLATPFSRTGLPPRIVAAGRLHPKKGFDVLVAALALLRDGWEGFGGQAFDCEIAGEGDERGRLEGLIAQHGLQDRVRLAGWRDDVPAFLATGDVFAFPSYQEGFPLVLLEAMAVGLPVVSSAIAGPVELIADGVDGALVPPGDPAALARALAGLVATPQKAVALGVAARAKVLAEYGPASLQRRLDAVLDRMLGRA